MSDVSANVSPMKVFPIGTWGLNKPKFYVHNFNGKEYYGIVEDNYRLGINNKSVGMGNQLFYDIPSDCMVLTLDEIIVVFKKHRDLRTTSRPEVKEGGNKWDRDPKLRMEMANRLIAIIQQSNQEGEVSAARAMYKKLMGEEYKG